MAYSRQSDGAFDITVGPLMKVWGFYKGEGALPRPSEVTDALIRVGHRHVRLDAATRTIHFDRPGVELDPGGRPFTNRLCQKLSDRSRKDIQPGSAANPAPFQ
jgi:thiamine biosynthesis lipoprotein ApbE